MCLVHLLAYCLVVASVKSVADSKNAVFLAKYEVGTLVVFLSYLSLDFLKLLPCAVAESLEMCLRMLCCDMLYDILAAVAAVVVRRTCKFVLNARVEQYELVSDRTERTRGCYSRDA